MGLNLLVLPFFTCLGAGINLRLRQYLCHTSKVPQVPDRLRQTLAALVRLHGVPGGDGAHALDGHTTGREHSRFEVELDTACDGIGSKDIHVATAE